MIARSLLIASLALAAPAVAHDGVVHATEDEAIGHLAEGLPLPLNLGGPFTLIDQTGAPRTEADPAGHIQLLFFGYANCREICSAALPQMADIADGLAGRGIKITPVMITVDPERDTVASLGPALQKFSPDFIGLTGSPAALANAYKLFSIETEEVFVDPQNGPVYAHGSFLYVLDGKGKFLTVIPPILSNARVMEIIAGYAVSG